MRNVGTVVRGIRTPVIKENSNLEDIVVDSLMKASESDNFTFHDKDIVAVTEAVVGIAMGNYVTVDEIAKDIKNKFGTNHIGVVFPILSRNRFAVLLSAIARAMDKITLQISYPSDEVGNDILDKKRLKESGINPYTDVIDEKTYYEKFGDFKHIFTGVNMVDFYKDLVKKEYNSNSEIGYHSYDHTLFTKNKIKNIINDFDKTNKIYYEITKDYLSLTRPPYGEYNNKILKELNTSFILWDKDTHDWKYKDTEFIVKYVLENANDKDIILFHDSYKTTVKAVKKLIDILYENNIKVLSVTNYAKENNIKLENKVYYSFK